MQCKWHVAPSPRAGCRTRHDPWQDAFDVLVCGVLEPRIRRPPGIVLAQHLRNSIRVDGLRLRQEPLCLAVVAERLLLEPLLGEKTFSGRSGAASSSWLSCMSWPSCLDGLRPGRFRPDVFETVKAALNRTGCTGLGQCRIR